MGRTGSGRVQAPLRTLQMIPAAWSAGSTRLLPGPDRQSRPIGKWWCRGTGSNCRHQVFSVRRTDVRRRPQRSTVIFAQTVKTWADARDRIVEALGLACPRTVSPECVVPVRGLGWGSATGRAAHRRRGRRGWGCRWAGSRAERPGSFRVPVPVWSRRCRPSPRRKRRRARTGAGAQGKVSGVRVWQRAKAVT